MGRSGWKFTGYSMTLDMPKIKQRLFHEMIKINQKATRVWLTEAVFGTPIPLWSGASRASFSKLASQVGMYIPSGPRVSGCPFPRGHAFGMKFDRGTKVELEKGKFLVGFTFATRLPHLLYNESSGPNPGPYPAPWSRNVRFTPYHFANRAMRTWKRYAKRQKLPNPFQWMEVKRIR
jgi:hypothetical protein